MYGEENDGVEANIAEREAFFKEQGLECSCRPGYVVCYNCMAYYSTGGRLLLKARKLRRFKPDGLFKR